MTSAATYAARLFPGLLFLNSGLGKRNLDAETAAGMQGFASAGIPAVSKLDPKTFGKLLSAGEIATGAALLAPVLPNRVAGAALTAFGAGFMSMYLRAPGQRQEGSLAPTQDGMSLAKDSWLLGIGAALLLAGDKK
ncbi:MAG TPA: hypothetical protein GX015_06220 [Corynebacterium sp.]|uniref:hypothetical protein n=1 Tax=Corynebacterium sp. TaxID=1720 RepID=UPI00182251E3|nr:hypothetical protein [Corynebacterium sp.]HHT32127.1 hypothetical protein [Corynebacterium sp.]